jgi:hypothetical protein
VSTLRKTESGLYYGNVDSEVGKFLSLHFHNLPPFHSAIVLSIDSTCKPINLMSMLRHFQLEARLETAGVVLTPNQLYNAVCHGFFTCTFDKILLLNKDPSELKFPIQISLHSYLEGLLDSIPKVEAEMRAAGGVLAMSDGIALSYATWDATFAEFIERVSVI